MERPQHPPAGLSREEAALYIGVSLSTFDTLVRTGVLPKPLPLGRLRRRIWFVEALNERLRQLSGMASETRRSPSPSPAAPRVNAPRSADTASDPWLARIRER